jgi:hypothetical protein
MKSHSTLICLAVISLVSAGFVFAKGPGGGGPAGGPGNGPGNSGGGGARGIDRPVDIAPREPDKAEKPVSHPARSASPSAHRLADSMHDINRTSFAQRREVLDSVDMRLESSRDSLRQIQANAKNLREDARAEFKASLDAVKAREKEFADAAKAARKAEESGWENARVALAKAHRAHADALGRLESLAPPAPPALPKPPTP